MARCIVKGLSSEPDRSGEYLGLLRETDRDGYEDAVAIVRTDGVYLEAVHYSRVKLEVADG